MKTIHLAVATAIIALLASASGCAPRARHHVTTRNVVSVTSGGNQEVWLVMSEIAGDVDKNRVRLRHDVYAVYHCIPTGCKRVGEVSGLQVQRQEGSR